MSLVVLDELYWSRGVAVNMPACHAGDRRFDPGRDRHFIHNVGSIAQSVEQRTENPRVGGSIPSRATILKKTFKA
jgi:hypothetical protein